MVRQDDGDPRHAIKRTATVRVLQGVAVLGFLVSALINLSTWLGLEPVEVSMIVFAVFPLMFITFFVVIFMYRIRFLRGANSVRRIFPFIPPWSRFVFVAIFFYTVAVGFYGTISGGLAGQPEKVGSRYYFNDHGHNVPTTRAAYLRGLDIQSRMFSRAELVFFEFSALVFTFAPPPAG